MDFQQKYSAIQIRCLLLVYFCLNPVVAAPFRDSRDVPEYVSHTHANGNRMHESGNRTTQLENESLGHPATERLYRQRTLRGRTYAFGVSDITMIPFLGLPLNCGVLTYPDSSDLPRKRYPTSSRKSKATRNRKVCC